MKIVEREGLHYIIGVPDLAAHGVRAVVFLAAVACAGTLLGILIERRHVERGLWWVALGVFILCVRFAGMQFFRWQIAITVETVLALVGLLVLAYGLRARVLSGRAGT